MKNTLTDVHNLLVEQLETLCDQDIKGEELDEALRRAEGASSIAKRILDNSRLALDAHALAAKLNEGSANPLDAPMLSTRAQNGSAGPVAVRGKP